MLVNKEKLAALVRERNKDKRHKICLFLGAGADIASGGMTFTELKQICYERMTGKIIVSGTPEQTINKAFETIFAKHLATDERARLVEKYFRDTETLEPSESYLILALLLRLGGIDAIITTNFDIMLEAAADRLGGHSFEVFSPGAKHPIPINNSFLHSSRPPYVKVHGDFAAKTITVITDYEIEHGKYVPEIEGIIREIFSTHHLVFAGYSGYDTGLANIISESVSRANNYIFWCNPNPPRHDAPLMKALSSRVNYIESSFDECIAILAEDLMKHGNMLLQSSNFLLPIFHWRINFLREKFVWPTRLGNKSKCTDKNGGIYVRRKNAESSVREFLRSSKNIAVVVAPSGYGKTTLAWKVSQEIDEFNGRVRVLPISAKSLVSNDFELELMQKCAPAATDLGITSLERWLYSKDIQLCVILDGVNEYSADINECVMLFRNIIRIGFALRDGAMLRIVSTMRHETWSRIQERLDNAQLSSVMWAPQGNATASIRPIVLDRYSPEELDLALRTLHTDGHDVLWASNIPIGARQFLRDPFLLHIVLQINEPKRMLLSPTTLFDSYIDGKLSGAGGYITRLAIESLAKLAALCQGRAANSFRLADITNACINNSTIENLIFDSGLIKKEGDGLYRFSHDRIEEFFLAKAINAHFEGAPCIDHLIDIIEFIENKEGTLILFGAIRRHILSKSNLFYELLLSDGNHAVEAHIESKASIARLRAFAKEILLEAAYAIPEHVLAYANTVIDSWPARTTTYQVSSALQATALLSPECAAPVFESAIHLNEVKLSNEAWVFFTDALASLIVNLDFNLEEEPFKSYLYGDSNVSWQPIIRVLGLMSAIGPDNMDVQRYAIIIKTLKNTLDFAIANTCLNNIDIQHIALLIEANLDRYAFNMTVDELEKFFSNQRRHLLIHELRQLQIGKALTRSNILNLLEFTRAETYHAEFILLNVLFSLSAINDFDNTLKAWSDHVLTFNEKTHPEEIDFFTGVVAYIFIAAGRPYNGCLDELTRRLPDSLQQAFYHMPGLRRGMARGFKDVFDMVFEDGFNPIAGYSLVAPSSIPMQLHKRIQHGASIEESEKQLVLPIMREMLSKLLHGEQFEKVVRVIHALGQAFSVWPREALLVLEPLCGIQDREVRKALLRVLREAFARRPLETRLFLDSVRGSFTADELSQIRFSEINNVGIRQFETVEWARILHFIFAISDLDKQKLYKGIEALLTTSNLEEAIKTISTLLNIYSAGENK